MKLYRVKLKGMCETLMGTQTAYGHPYVIAKNSTEALNKVQKYLSEKNIGFSKEREMNTIELLAEEGNYPECQIQLFL